MSSKNAATASEMINYVLDSLQPSFRTNYKEVLGEFDHYFFKMKPLLNQQEATVLLVGKPGKIGLMQHCGMTAKFSQSFRNSSCVAVSLLSRLADPSCNPSSGTLFANILKTLQQTEQFKDMLLDKHVSGNFEGNRDDARRLLDVLQRTNIDSYGTPSNIASQPSTSNQPGSSSAAPIDASRPPLSGLVPVNADYDPRKKFLMPQNRDPSSVSRAIPHDPKQVAALNGQIGGLPSQLQNKGIIRGGGSEQKGEDAVDDDEGGFAAAVKSLFSFFSGGGRKTKKQLEEKGVLKKQLIFGRSLKDMQADGLLDKDGVPLHMKTMLDFIYHRDDLCNTLGLFRISGDSLQIQDYKRKLDFGEKVDPASASVVHVVTGVIKLWFREMPAPILSFEHYDAFVKEYRAGNAGKMVALVDSLDPLAIATTNYLLDFCIKVATFEEQNKMSAQNLAIVFAPNLLRPKVETYEKIAKDTPATIGVVKLLIEERKKAKQGQRERGNLDDGSTSDSERQVEVAHQDGPLHSTSPISVAATSASIGRGGASGYVAQMLANKQAATSASAATAAMAVVPEDSTHVCNDDSPSTLKQPLQHSAIHHRQRSSMDCTPLPLPPPTNDDDSNMLPPGWQEFKDPSGKSYFHMAATGVTQWDRPAQAAPPPPEPPQRKMPPRPSQAMMDAQREVQRQRKEKEEMEIRAAADAEQRRTEETRRFAALQEEARKEEEERDRLQREEKEKLETEKEKERQLMIAKEQAEAIERKRQELESAEALRRQQKEAELAENRRQQQAQEQQAAAAAAAEEEVARRRKQVEAEKDEAMKKRSAQREQEEAVVGAEAEDSVSLLNSANPPRPPTSANPPEEKETWIEYTDKSSGKLYYYNPTTKVTTWVKPADANIARKTKSTMHRRITSMPAVADSTSGSAFALQASIAGAHSASIQVFESSPLQPGWGCAKILHKFETSDEFSSSSSSSSLSSGVPGLYLDFPAQSSCGGCYPNFRTWRANPQFLCRPVDITKDVNIIIELEGVPSRGSVNFSSSSSSATEVSDDNEKKQKKGVYGFYVFKHTGPFSHKVCVMKGEISVRSPFVSKGKAVSEVTLPAVHHSQKSSQGYAHHYSIVASTLEPGVAMNFQLVVHYSDLVTITELATAERAFESKIAGDWVFGSTAGGCRNHSSWVNNPQFLLTKENKCTVGAELDNQTEPVVVILSQPASSAQVQAIGMYIFTSIGVMVSRASFMISTEVSCVLDYDHSSAPYIVVPCTFEPDHPGDFVLSVLSKNAKIQLLPSNLDENDEHMTQEDKDIHHSRKRTMSSVKTKETVN